MYRASCCAIVTLSLPKGRGVGRRNLVPFRMKLSHTYFVYILQCSDGFYYTGITNNLDRRLREHEAGVDPFCYTFKRRPLVLKYFEQYTEVTQAISREKQLKGWSRAKKEALFATDYDALKELAKCTEEKRRAATNEEPDGLGFDPSASSG